MALAGSKKRKIFDGRYEILSIVGRGACSVVYHARHAVAQATEVALKVLLNEKDQKANGEKLRKEALAMVSSRHKYVVRLDDFHSVGELCYLSMEYAPESDLRRYAGKTGGKLSAVQAELFLLQLAEALAFIHRAGIVHRDIKPDNILVINPKEIRLADFGVALLPGDKSSLAELQKGVGTMDYMAPEVLEGKNYDLQSDIYALGVTFYEMLSGKHPFANAPLVDQLNVRRDGKFPHLRDLAPQAPAYLANAIMQALSYEPSGRFPSTKELAQALIVNRPKPADPRAKPTTATHVAPQAGAPLTSGAQAISPQAASPAALAQPGSAQTAVPSQPPAPTQATGQATTPTAAPSNAVLAAIRAAAAAKKPAPPTPSAAAPLPASASSKPETAAGTKPSMLQADSAEARRAAARALLSGGSTPAVPKAPPSGTASGIAQKVEVTTTAPTQGAAENKSPAPTQPSAPKASAAPQAAAARPTNPVTRDVAPTQTLSAEKVAEVTAGSKQSASLLSRALDSSAAVAQPSRTSAERGPRVSAAVPSQAAPSIQQNLAVAAKDVFTKQDKAIPGGVDSKKATQLITRDLVNQVRNGMKDEDKKIDLTGGALKAGSEVEETVILKPEHVKAAQQAKKGKKDKKQKEAGNKAPLTSELWRKDPRKSRYMALSMGILLAILWFGNIFLIKNYHIGVGKSLLGYDDSYASPIPQYSGSPLAFPAIPSGLYSGVVTNLPGGRQAPLALISFGEQKKLTVIVGIEGWTPAVVSVAAETKPGETPLPVRIVSNGVVLNMNGEVSGAELHGTFQDMITGDVSEWRAKPVVANP